MIERVDADTLLVPLAGTPAGDDVREGGPGSDIYLRIKDDRAAARTAEREASNADSDVDPLRVGLDHWSALAEGAVELLTDQAKDLEVAAWLTEALLRTGGIAGLADGFVLLDGLIAGFWDDGLWPAADEDGDETRLGALFGLFGRGGTGTLLQPLKLTPLSDRGGAPVTLSSAEIAFTPPPPRTADEEAEAIAEARRTAAIEAVTSGIGRSPRAFLVALRADLARAAAALEVLMRTIDRVSDVGRFGSQIGEPLATAIKLLDDYAGNLVPLEAEPAAAEATTGGDGTAPAGTVATVGGRAPASREEALRAVLTLADYFDRSEPQAPIGLSLREVVRRARLPLEGLLSELLPDADTRALFLLRAGIRSSTSDVDAVE